MNQHSVPLCADRAVTIPRASRLPGAHAAVDIEVITGQHLVERPIELPGCLGYNLVTLEQERPQLV
ncbi:hypothetical protein JJC00_08150 [Bradyrhizobium diazoefficiens]|nr:hypothetical protein [Bradyrhizobium diazoefficiens]QQO35566.1 hypothetical protein JJC00_08150 [Bradyrhizobium diazoefficiens]